jgi:hypothetical protein
MFIGETPNISSLSWIRIIDKSLISFIAVGIWARGYRKRDGDIFELLENFGELKMFRVRHYRAWNHA